MSTRGLQIEAGSTIDDYTLVRKLGQGGMGEVWMAEQLSLSRHVALKLLLPGRADARSLEFFAREARAGGRLSHPGIVSVYGTGQSDGLHWIAMELVEDGFDLKDSLESIRDEPKLEPDYYECCALLLARVAEALEAAHQEGVIHRDLKPANILLTPEDQPKLTDFGLAKLTDEHSISVAGELVGTYYYMSPEQVATKRMGLDHRTDIFSFGIVMYEMLTLVRPFEGDTTEQVARKITLVDPARPSDVRSKVPRDLSVICGKCLEKDPERRFQSMAGLAADLRRYLADEPIAARPPGALERGVKWARRHPAWSAATGVAVVALVAISWLGLVARGQAQLATRRAQQLELANADLESEQARTRAALEQVEARAGELKQVSEFQAEQLSGVDPVAMGLGIRSGVLERARAARERTGRTPEALDAEEAELRRLLAGTDFTGIAVGLLDEQIFARALEELEGLANQPLLQARLLEVVGLTLQELGLYERARVPQEKALELRRRELGDEHPDTLASVNHLGTLLLTQENVAEAEPLVNEALEGRRRVLGEEHIETLTSGGNLCALLHARGELEQSAACLREHVDDYRRVLGDEHPKTLTAITNLGNVLQGLGRYEEAQALDEEALRGSRRLLGDEHPKTLRKITSLGSLLFLRGKYDEAELLLVEALEARRRTLGDEHPDTLHTMNSMASLLKEQGRLDEATRLLREMLKGSRRLWGDDHPETQLALAGLGALFAVQGNYGESEVLLSTALEYRRRTLGDGHPKTLVSMSNLGNVLSLARKHEAAEMLLAEALDGALLTHGEDHPFTLKQLSDLGAMYEREGRDEEAEELGREALEGRRRVLGDDHPDTLNSMNNLGALLHKVGEQAEATRLLLEALEGRRRVLGDDHPDTLSTMTDAGIVLRRQGKSDEAEELHREALRRRRRLLGDEHPETRATAQRLESLDAEREASPSRSGEDSGESGGSRD